MKSIFLPIYLYIWPTPYRMGYQVKPNSNSVEVHPQLSHTRHPSGWCAGVLVHSGQISCWWSVCHKVLLSSSLQVQRVRTSVGRFSLFSENRRFQFLGQVLRIAPVLFQKISHYENRLDYQKKFKNLVRRFSELAVLTEFWIISFEGRFSQVGSHKSWYIYISFLFFFVCFFSCNQRFFGDMKLGLVTNLLLNWVCPVLSFPESFQPIAATMCTVCVL